MSREPKVASIEELLAHAGWLRGLAVRLGQGHDSDDLVQETWTAALASPPRADRATEPWLAVVVRNLVRRRWRDGRIRERARHVLVASEMAGTSPQDLLERAQLQRVLAEAVVELDEPYRSTILLRYYEDKSSAEIAKLHRIPEGTVRWRLSEAVDRLRRRLDAGYGGKREVWLAPLSLVKTSNRRGDLEGLKPGAHIGALLMAFGAKGKVAIAIAVMLVLVGLGVRSVLVKHLAIETPKNERAASVASGDPARRGSALGEGALAVAEVVATIEGVATLPDGRPAENAMVSLSSSDVTAEYPIFQVSAADARGSFRFRAVLPQKYFLSASTSRRGIVPSEEVSIEARARSTEHVRLLLRRGGHTIHGRVMDTGAGPIPGARVSAVVGAREPGRPASQFVATAADDGSYSLTLIDGQYAVDATADGYAKSGRALTLTSDTNADFVLEPDAQATGRVIHKKTREPVPGALVQANPTKMSAYYHQAVRTDADGTFRIPGLEEGDWIIEARLGRLVGRTDAASVAPGRTTGGIEVLVEPGAIVTGRVYGPNEQSVGKALVVAARAGTRITTGARADDHGNFRLEGLSPGTYDVHVSTLADARSRRTLVVQDADVSGVAIAVGAVGVIQGRVTDENAVPLAGVRVTVYSTRPEAAGASLGGRIEVTNDNGTFTAAGIQAGAVAIKADREGFGNVTWGPESVGAGQTRVVDLRLMHARSVTPNNDAGQ